MTLYIEITLYTLLGAFCALFLHLLFTVPETKETGESRDRLVYKCVQKKPQKMDLKRAQYECHNEVIGRLGHDDQ